MKLPWEKHRHRTDKPDAEGDTCCTECGLVLSGPALAEARELARLLGMR